SGTLIIGCILDFCLNCGPSGSFLKHGVGCLAVAKFQFQLGRPDNMPFAADFDNVLEVFDQLQSATAISLTRCNLIVVDGLSCNIRFSQSIFEKCVCIHCV
ncbi:hypothetical protein EI94DRAFT_1579431, partial [Lactarius quietus]